MNSCIVKRYSTVAHELTDKCAEVASKRGNEQVGECLSALSNAASVVDEWRLWSEHGEPVGANEAELIVKCLEGIANAEVALKEMSYALGFDEETTSVIALHKVNKELEQLK